MFGYKDRKGDKKHDFLPEIVQNFYSRLETEQICLFGNI